MSRELLIGQLRQGNTGNEILSILDALVSGVDDSAPVDSQPTSDPIDF